MLAAPRDDIGRAELIRLQNQRLSDLLRDILPANRFYARKFREAAVDVGSLSLPAELTRLPFTTKAELLEDQARHPPYGEVLTFPAERYSRLHQTSGTSGRPLRWLDTPESWSRLLDCWVTMFRIASVGSADRLFFPFSFGPFLGFWTAFEAASRMGCLCLPGGGLSSTRPPALSCSTMRRPSFSVRPPTLCALRKSHTTKGSTWPAPRWAR